MGKSKRLFFWPVMDWIMMLSIFQSFSIPTGWWRRVTWRGRSQSWKDDGDDGDRRLEQCIDQIIGPWIAESCLANQWFGAADEFPSALVSSLAALLPISSNLPVTSYLRTQLFFFFFFLERWITLEVISQCRRSDGFSIPTEFHLICA